MRMAGLRRFLSNQKDWDIDELMDVDGLNRQVESAKAGPCLANFVHVITVARISVFAIDA